MGECECGHPFSDHQKNRNEDANKNFGPTSCWNMYAGNVCKCDVFVYSLLAHMDELRNNKDLLAAEDPRSESLPSCDQ